MDANEVSRQTAERLHLTAVSRGDDSREPYAFACAEAKRRNLAVEKVPPNDVRLHGGCTLYDPDALLILHEDVGDDFANAFLVAHEVGHVEFGGLEEFASTTCADPLRSSEAAPVGVERVIDYSRKERREVQMDLFAREFLLPRSWLRRLHIDDQTTASEIAVQCRAPFAVVAQQLFDALLLPAVILAPPKCVTVKPLNGDQRKAVEHRGQPYLLEAGPGTGKTQTLVARVADLLASGVSAGRMLVLTFSNKAAGELSERISLHHPEAAAGMWIGTFHAFGLDLVRRFHDRLGLPVEPRLLDRTDVTGISQDSASTPTLAALEEQLAAAWEAQGPDNHGYGDDYLRIASQLIRFYFDSTSAMNCLPVPELRLPIAVGEIIIIPDQVLTDAAGMCICGGSGPGTNGPRTRRISPRPHFILPLPLIRRAARCS